MRVAHDRLALLGLVLLGSISSWHNECRGQIPRPREPGKLLIEAGRKTPLGVGSVTMADGALVTYVVPDSPGWKAGLEPGDVILSIDGYRVGIIDGLPYHPWSEVRRIKRAGVFKIRDRHTGEIVSKTITLGAGSDGGDSGPPDPEPGSGPEE
jgi:S1-C subfamily serine protease